MNFPDGPLSLIVPCPIVEQFHRGRQAFWRDPASGELPGGGWPAGSPVITVGSGAFFPPVLRMTGGIVMATYIIMLINWRDQGVQAAKDSPQRAEQAIGLIEQMSGHMRTLLWTLEHYNLVG